MAKQKSSLATFGLLAMVATVAGFVVALLVSVFVLQSLVKGGHRQQLGDAVAAELAQQINIKEGEIQALLTRLAATDLAKDAIGGSTSDLLDAEGTEEAVGKRVGKDADRGKLTFPALVGAEASRTRARALAAEATAACRVFGSRGDHLAALAHWIISRNH